MFKPLLRISAFARAVDLTPSALRFYDECGLLSPTEVDAQTGYRYYTPDLHRRAHMISAMRDVGVPVETMRLVLDGDHAAAVAALRAFAARPTRARVRWGPSPPQRKTGIGFAALPPTGRPVVESPRVAS